MARPSKVNYRLPSKTAKTYVAGIYTDCEGKKVKNKSLKTKDPTEASIICQHLQELFKINMHFEDERLERFHPTAYQLYYHKPAMNQISKDEVKGLKKEIDSDDDKYVMAWMIREIKRLRKENELLQEKAKIYEGWKKTKEGQYATADKDMPSNEEIIRQYREIQKGLESNTITDNVNNAQWLLDKYDSKHVCQITTADIESYLVEDSAENENPEKRWNRTYIRLTKFFNFLEKRWVPNNPMSPLEMKKIRTPSKIKKQHSIKEVKAAIEDEEELYWKLIIAIFGFQGLSAHELRGLRRDCIEKKPKGKALKVEPSPEVRLKSAQRSRYVLIHKKRVWPLLKQYLKETEETEFLFPPQHPSKKNYWDKSQFSRYLAKHTPEGMNALSQLSIFL